MEIKNTKNGSYESLFKSCNKMLKNQYTEMIFIYGLELLLLKHQYKNFIDNLLQGATIVS